MHEPTFEGYDEWDLTPISMPPRSPLYVLQPIGMGTPLVESLSSYMARLAEAHSVFPGVLISKVIGPRAPGYALAKRPHGLFREGGARSTLFNGVGLPARRAVQALATLTLRTDLQYLTLLPLAAVLPRSAKGLIRLTKAWCPVCYEEWREMAQMIYDPLLWALQAITSCARHSVRLSTSCPYPDCARSLPGMAWRSRVGYCSYCQRWLGLASVRAKAMVAGLEETEWGWQQWVAEALGAVLALLPSVSVLPERQRVRQVVAHAVEQISAGDLPAFARTLALSRNTIYYWCQGEQIPDIDMLLRLCCRLGLSLRDFFFQEVDTLRPQLQETALPVSVVSRKREVIQEEQVYQVLEQAATSKEQPPPTLRLLARRSGHTPLVLYKIHPTACGEIVARHKAYAQQRKEARLQKFREEIRHIALKLHAEGEVLTQKSIAPHLSQPGVLRDPRVRTFLKEICLELENGLDMPSG